MCCACHARADKSELIRVVKTRDGSIAVDGTKKADGRGVWIHSCEACIDKVLRRKLLSSAFRTAVSEEVYEQLKGR